MRQVAVESNNKAPNFEVFLQNNIETPVIWVPPKSFMFDVDQPKLANRFACILKLKTLLKPHKAKHALTKQRHIFVKFMVILKLLIALNVMYY